MTTWQLIREVDPSGVSGIGRVAEVVELENGKAVVGWLSGTKSVAVYDTLSDVLRIHGHNGLSWLERIESGRLIQLGRTQAA